MSSPARSNSPWTSAPRPPRPGTAAVAAITAEIQAIAARRGVGLSIDLLQDLPESPCDPALTGLLEEAVRATGLQPLRLPSGAGHDAMVMADLTPTAMLFIPLQGRE